MGILIQLVVQLGQALGYLLGLLIVITIRHPAVMLPVLLVLAAIGLASGIMAR